MDKSIFGKMEDKIKTLLVEDQLGPLETIAIAFRIEFLEESTPIRLCENPQKDLEEKGIDVARNYEDAINLIEQRSYDIIFLDHNIPRKDDLETENIGYTLIPEIKRRNPETYIVGTSSESNLSREYVPDCKMPKMDLVSSGTIREIYQRLGKRK